MFKKRKVRPATVDGLVIKKGKILLVKRNHEPCLGYWAIPGGFVEEEETCEEAVVREVREETGFKTTVVKFLGVYSDPSRSPEHTVSAVYFLKILGGKMKKSEEAQDIAWFPLDKLPPLAFDHRLMIEDYLKSRSKLKDLEEKSSLTPEFFEWLSQIGKKYEGAIKELAQK